MATLQAAVAFAEVNDFAFAVGEDLKFDVVRAVDEFLDVNGCIGESAFGFGTSGMKSFDKAGSLCAARMPQPPPPPAALIITG